MAINSIQIRRELVGLSSGGNNFNNFGMDDVNQQRLDLHSSVCSRSYSRPLKVAEKRIVNEFGIQSIHLNGIKQKANHFCVRLVLYFCICSFLWPDFTAIMLKLIKWIWHGTCDSGIFKHPLAIFQSFFIQTIIVIIR